MSKTAEQITVLTFDREVTHVSIEEDGRTVKIFTASDCNQICNETISKPAYTKEWIDKYFPIVHASELSLEDELIKYEPQTKKQADFKKRLIRAIKSGLSDFRAQHIDPSLDENEDIIYKEGKPPAVGKSANWWMKNAKNFLPEKESRLGSTNQRIAFLAFIIKDLIKKGQSESEAWYAVCDQSKDLGHYCNSPNAKDDFEPTGSRQIGIWSDLGNTYKITINDEVSGFSLFGGFYNNNGDCYPLAGVCSILYPGGVCICSVGWLVLSV